MHVGDIVTRKSYANDINFIIQEIKEDQAVLSGVDFRLIADAKLSDLEEVSIRSPLMFGKIKRHIKDGVLVNPYTTLSDEAFVEGEEDVEDETEEELLRGKCFGKVLHIDANTFYLEQSLRQYVKLGVPAIGVSVWHIGRSVAAVGPAESKVEVIKAIRSMARAIK